jgi:hypothetical protein
LGSVARDLVDPRQQLTRGAVAHAFDVGRKCLNERPEFVPVLLHRLF